MIEIIKKSFYRNGYLLIIAAWLYTISFIFSNYWFYTSSPKRVKQELESFVVKSEKKFDKLVSYYAVIKSISINPYQPDLIRTFVPDKVAVFIYSKNDVGNYLLDFWNNNTRHAGIDAFGSNNDRSGATAAGLNKRRNNYFVKEAKQEDNQHQKTGGQPKHQ